MASQVRVQDVGELRSYGTQLSALREELIDAASRLASLADEMANTAGGMKSATDSQGSNWSDPQYEALKDDVNPVADSISTTSESMRQTASLVNSRMSSVEESIGYIFSLVAKLEDI